MNQSSLPRGSGSRRGRRGRLVAAATAAAVVAGLGAAPSATSAPSDACPEAFPVDKVDKDLKVTGLTVSSGSTPETFEGKVLGVLDNGIAPGLDMILARLTSPEIDRVGGIWAGMSGSPVYAEDGRLIGAVAYGLAFGPSTVAGITPAGDMYGLLTKARTDPKAAKALANPRQKVKVPESLARRLVRGEAVQRQLADDGMSRLPLPVGISGMSSDKRLKKAAKSLDLEGVRYFRAGAVSADAAETPVEAGGNLAASLSYGDVSAVGVGTATAVCGRKVVGFGHPMIFSGPSTLTMHGAEALYVQEDPTLTPFKVANATAPLGRIRQDRLAGILGVDGRLPATTEVTSTVRVRREGSRDGTTFISVPDAVPDIAPFHLLANEDRVFDGISEGSAMAGWTVTGTREDGSPFSYTRRDKYASKFDISFEPVIDLSEQLFRLQFNDIEEITLTSVEEIATMSRRFRAYKLAEVEVRRRSGWRELATDRPLRLRAGTEQPLRVTLTSSQLPTERIRLTVPAPPPRTVGQFGFLDIVGGNSHFGGFFEEESTSAPSFEALLAELDGAPRNDQVLAELFLFRNDGSVIQESNRRKAKAVVDGGVSVEVFVTG